MLGVSNIIRHVITLHLTLRKLKRAGVSDHGCIPQAPVPGCRQQLLPVISVVLDKVRRLVVTRPGLVQARGYSGRIGQPLLR